MKNFDNSLDKIGPKSKTSNKLWKECAVRSGRRKVDRLEMERPIQGFGLRKASVTFFINWQTSNFSSHGPSDLGEF